MWRFPVVLKEGEVWRVIVLEREMIRGVRRQAMSRRDMDSRSAPKIRAHGHVCKRQKDACMHACLFHGWLHTHELELGRESCP